ncbi:MAG: geranylgeranylglyceryl/heptaprenylglyceryl phosphate synthase [Saprospiraceae bacterium]|nr:geranylgeranylglyceryl/heptaprenylglyceryl phosphate synthase [Saprospiraceae bacterium]
MVYQKLIQDSRFGEKKIGLLIDPDKQGVNQLADRVRLANQAQVDYFLIGGSLLHRDTFHETVETVKQETDRPVILFPGSAWQISDRADALLFLSLISGRNPDLLIGQQVQAAPMLDRLDLEVIPTGYLLVDGGLPTTASYISQTAPLPAHKPEIAVATALAGKYLGMQLLYLDAGSGARNPVSPEMVRQVKKATRLPLLVGGGIRTPDQASVAARAGADVIVIGTVAEQDISILPAMVQAVHSSLHLAG